MVRFKIRFRVRVRMKHRVRVRIVFRVKMQWGTGRYLSKPNSDLKSNPNPASKV